jgi:crotonobetainyl-CoA:carnitine CoA-transferase CaiB-like acyl-CoA transferase
MVDVSMSDGALSWLAMVAGAYFADGAVPRRGDLPLAGALVCYRPYECADGWVSLGALEPKFWRAWCRGVGREDLVAMQFERPGSDAHAQVQEIFKGRTRAEWEAFAREHDCCLEPVLELDEALEHARLPGPALGEHTEEVLAAAGYSPEQVAELLESGAVAGPTEKNGSPPTPAFRA